MVKGLRQVIQSQAVMVSVMHQATIILSVESFSPVLL